MSNKDVVYQPNPASEPSIPLAAIICISIVGYLAVLIALLGIRKLLKQQGKCSCNCNDCFQCTGEGCKDLCQTCDEVCSCCRICLQPTQCLNACCPNNKNCQSCDSCSCCPATDSCLLPNVQCCGCAQCTCQLPQCDNINCLCCEIRMKNTARSQTPGLAPSPTIQQPQHSAYPANTTLLPPPPASPNASPGPSTSIPMHLLPPPSHQQPVSAPLQSTWA